MQQQNLLNQKAKDELGKSSRLDTGFPDDLKGSYDEFGFEKREARKAYLPIFIPFDQLMVRDEQLEKIKQDGKLQLYSAKQSERLKDKQEKDKRKKESIKKRPQIERKAYKKRETIVA